MVAAIDLIGNTPVVQLKNITSSNSADIYVKLEEFNLGGSIKSRIALQLITDAEKKEILSPHSGQTIIKPTGGNTGAGLALIIAMRGYNVILVMPDNYSPQKIETLKAYGATVILSNS
jgi:cysteine synthase A